MLLYLVRHGEADSQLEGAPLTEIGHQQAKRCAAYLRAVHADKIISSGLLRAQQTADYMDKPYEIDDRLNEIYRVLVGGPEKQNSRPNRAVEDQERIEAVWSDLMKEDNGKVIVFCHGNVINYLIAKVLGCGAQNMWETSTVRNCSVSVIRYKEGKIRLLCHAARPEGIDYVGKKEHEHVGIRDLFRITQKAILVDGDRILLVQHHSGKWDLPGGHIDHGENLDQGIRRELTEELGVDFDNLQFFKSVSVQKYRLFTYYYTTYQQQKITLSDEHLNVGWFLPSELTDLELQMPYMQEHALEVLKLLKMTTKTDIL